jgi:subtilisin family serine protease
MIAKRLFLGLALLASISLNAWAASSYSVVCAVNPGTDINKVAAFFGGKVVRQVLDDAYLLSVKTLPGNSLPLEVQYCEENQKSGLPGFSGGVVLVNPSAPDRWYRSQPAMVLVNVAKAQSVSTGRGVIIADIDSAVDYSHPALRGVLTSGYDFVAERAAGAATASLNQVTASFLDQSTVSFLDQVTASFLDQVTASFLDQSTANFLESQNPAHGHATMVAGILAAIAPESIVMPLRVFDDTGQADASDIARAIVYAVRHGARVINMSFGISENSKTLAKAIDFAQRNNVLLVASAGNNNTDKRQAPVGYPGVIGVGATDLQDRKAWFSNYGLAVDVAAPGINIVSSYPGGYYAVLSGTSFAAPIVTAEAALLLSNGPTNTANAIYRGTVNIDSKNPLYRMGFGRVDLFKALKELLK